MAAKTGESLPRRDKDFLKAMTLVQRREWAKKIIVRMMLAWDVKEMQHLSRFIGGHVRMPSNWITKGGIPWEVIYTCHLQTGCSIDWLYNGNVCAISATPELKADYQKKVSDLIGTLCRSDEFSADTKDKLQQAVELISNEAIAFFAQCQAQQQSSTTGSDV